MSESHPSIPEYCDNALVTTQHNENIEFAFVKQEHDVGAVIHIRKL